MEDRIVQNIVEALILVCPIEEINDYHKASIEKLVDHFKRYGQSKSPAFFLSFTESVQVDVLNNVVGQIELDVIPKKVDYLYKKDRDKSEYEQGVLSTIRLIQYRVHCICD